MMIHHLKLHFETCQLASFNPFNVCHVNFVSFQFLNQIVIQYQVKYLTRVYMSFINPISFINQTYNFVRKGIRLILQDVFP